MPRSSSGSDGGSRKRYAAVVEKGENAWKREWSSFMSGVNLKRLRDGTSGVSLKASADIERQLEAPPTTSAAVPPSSSSKSPVSTADAAGDVGVNSDGIPLNAAAASASFSYLFSSPAERRAERDARERAEREKRRAEKRVRMAAADPLSVLSKHQRALHDATQRGLQLEGMNRKARRDFLRLTVSEAQKKAEEQSREFKLHDLMDEKLAWYQQGPHPVDLISEKLVRRKAEKKAKQLGLKYNYLAPHASWIAKRAQRRRESLLVGLGKRLVFEDTEEAEEGGSGMTVTDPLRHRTVPLQDMGLLLEPSTAMPNAAAAAAAEAGDEAAAVEAVLQANSDDDDDGGEDSNSSNRANEEATPEVEQPMDKAGVIATSEEDMEGANDRASSSAVRGARMPNVGVLQDPTRLATSVVRSVVRDRATAMAIQQLNRTTTFLSSGLVKGPSLLPEDAALAKGLPVQTIVGSSSNSNGNSATALKSAAGPSPARQPKRPTRASAAPSFSPYATASMFEEEAESSDQQLLRAPVPPRESTGASNEKRRRARTALETPSAADMHEGEEEPVKTTGRLKVAKRTTAEKKPVKKAAKKA